MHLDVSFAYVIQKGPNMFLEEVVETRQFDSTNRHVRILWGDSLDDQCGK